MIGTIERSELIAHLLADRPDDLLVVTGLGSSTYDVATVEDNSKNFYLWGAMGQAASVGLGIAVAQPDKQVLVVTGDGEMLMGLGSLATVANSPPRNIGILVLDNGHYSETGGQPTHTSNGTDIEGVAAQCGFKATMTITETTEFGAAKDMLLTGTRPSLVVAKVALKEYSALVEPQIRMGHYIAARFRMDVTGRGEASLDT